MASYGKAGATGELALIGDIGERAARLGPSSAVRVGIGDDCAVLRPRADTDVVVTTDFSLEGRHFRRDWHPAASAGHRCLARGLSDLAAMGAEPLSAFLSLAVPAGLQTTAAGRRWVGGFLDGLFRLAEATGTPLSGGDTATAPDGNVLADIVLTGTVPRGKALLRSGARVGDLLYVTGALGGAAAELRMLEEQPKRFRAAVADGTHPQLFPEARLQVGRVLVRRRLSRAAMDLSDGLSTDLRHLCEASGVGAVVEAERLPLHTLAMAMPDGLSLALNGGEDYELLFAAGAAMRVPRRIAGVAVTRIGEVTAGGEVVLREGGVSSLLAAKGWEHRF